MHFKNNRKQRRGGAHPSSSLMADFARFACVPSATPERRAHRRLFLIKLSVCSLIKYRSDCKIHVATVGRSVYHLCATYCARKLWNFGKTLPPTRKSLLFILNDTHLLRRKAFFIEVLTEKLFDPCFCEKINCTQSIKSKFGSFNRNLLYFYLNDHHLTKHSLIDELFQSS